MASFLPSFFSFLAKCTVLVIQHQCGQTFSTHLGGLEGRSPVRRGCEAQSREIALDKFLSTFGKKFLVFENRIIGNTEFQKTIPYVTARPNNLRLSRRGVKNDVWKYLQIIVIGLYAVCGHLLDNQDRALVLLFLFPYSFLSFSPYFFVCVCILVVCVCVFGHSFPVW